MELLELNDLAIAWFDSRGSRRSQPGAALIERDGAVYGEPALARSRLSPRGFQDQYWQLLNSDSLPVTAPRVQNNADLVYRHLLELAGTPQGAATQDNRPPVLCAVPGTVTGDQLGLLLGIAGEAGINIASFVNSALLYCLDQPLPATAWCIDVHRRRGLLTKLTRDGTTLRATGNSELQSLGMNGLIDGWLDLLVDQFVARSRFDPLRVAETEQQLFDQVRNWLPEHGSLSATVDHQGNQRAVELSIEELSGRAQQRYRSAHSELPARSTVVLTPTAAALPGFAHYLSGHGHTVLLASGDALWRNSVSCPELNNPEAVVLLTSLSTTSEIPASSRHDTTREATATHALAGHIAVSLAELARNHATLAGTPATGYRVSSDSTDVQVNNATVTADTRLMPGDTLQIGSQSYSCIRVSDAPAGAG